MKVALTEVLERYVLEQVSSGLYEDTDEVIRDALRMKIRAEASEQQKLEALRRDIDIGWQQAERGECSPFDVEEFLEDLETSPEGAQ